MNSKIFIKKKFQNIIMKGGNKYVCENLFFNTFKLMQKNLIKNHKNLFKVSVLNTTSVIQLKTIKQKNRKVTREFPFFLQRKNRTNTSFKQIIDFLKIDKKKRFAKKLFSEIILLSNKNSEILKEKNKFQEAALLKKKYARYRWFY